VNVVGERFPLADAISSRISEQIEEIRAGLPCRLLDEVTPITSELLRFWFEDDFCAGRDRNFHAGQRDAIAAVIYAHEVLGSTTLQELYEQLDVSVLEPGRLGVLSAESNRHPKYAAKMATGTGKTWVMNALLIWQHLNALAAPSDPRFTSNFLIVAPGLIVYERLLDSFLGRRGIDGVRSPATGDIAASGDLFLPDQHRDAVLAFVRSSTIEKEEIGRRVTGSGVIAITNWHRLAGTEDPDFLDEDEVEVDLPGADVDIARAAASFVPLSPGTSAGNSLETLDRRAARGEAMQWLRSLPGLVVFNDEAHHVHSSRPGDEQSEVEWQRSLTELARGKDRRFVQIDFSATPYNEQRSRKIWFPHIVVDFDLTDAMTAGLVKALALDKRQEIAAIPNKDLEFRAVRADGTLELADGQRTMLRAGLKRLQILEEQFATVDPDRRPKMLVMVEDTKVSPLVEEFLREEGLGEDDYLRVDSKNKADLGPKEWEVVRDRLFDIDHRAQPRVIISVLMLREGFDVNNICVIVPLRSAASGILAEQTVGRGLRLMWRGDPAVEELKAETRDRIRRREKPTNFYDVLFVVEHPRFDDLYEELLGDGLLGVVDKEPGREKATGDSERVGLRDGYEAYDFAIPFIRRDVEEELRTPWIDVDSLARTRIPLDDLLRMAPGGDRFMAEDYETRTRFGAFTIVGAKLTARGYNEYLGKLVNRIGGAISRSFTEHGVLRQRSDPEQFAMLQVDRPLLLGWADRYIRTRFFAEHFDPLHQEQWRVLMIDAISDQIAGNLARALVETLGSDVVGEPEVSYRRISEVDAITVREAFSVEVAKCVYPRLAYPSHAGGLEREFIVWVDADSAVEAFVKVQEYQHGFVRRPYIKADGMPAQYSTDFLVRTAESVYVVETKAQSFIDDANVRRKALAATQWCQQINRLPASARDGREWHYVLLGEQNLRSWRDGGMTASQVLDFARERPRTESDDKLF
jgi:type III restriction enzyme